MTPGDPVPYAEACLFFDGLMFLMVAGYMCFVLKFGLKICRAVDGEHVPRDDCRSWAISYLHIIQTLVLWGFIHDPYSDDMSRFLALVQFPICAHLGPFLAAVIVVLPDPPNHLHKPISCVWISACEISLMAITAVRWSHQNDIGHRTIVGIIEQSVCQQGGAKGADYAPSVTMTLDASVSFGSLALATEDEDAGASYADVLNAISFFGSGIAVLMWMPRAVRTVLATNKMFFTMIGLVFFLMIGFTVTSETNLGNTNYMLWFTIDIALGFAATFSAMTAASRQETAPQAVRQLCGIQIDAVFTCMHAVWWLLGPFWSTSDGSASFKYAVRNPLVSSIPIVWLIDGGIVFLQLKYLNQRRTESRSQIGSLVEKCEEVFIWSCSWLYVLLCAVWFDAEVHSNKGYKRWLAFEWPFMLLSTLLLKIAAIKEKAAMEVAQPPAAASMAAAAGGRAFGLGVDAAAAAAAGACCSALPAAAELTLVNVSLAIALLNLLWWFAGLFRRTQATHEYAMRYAIEHPTESLIPFLWLMDGFFVLYQPFLQWKLAQEHNRRRRRHRSVHVNAREQAQELRVELLLQ